MREIKFRAYYQRVTDDEWVIEGEYTLKDLTDRGIKFDQVRIEWVQFTGLQDRNGADIYEGDIVKSGKKYWKIVFMTGCFVMCPIKELNQIQTLPSQATLSYFINEEIEIIGNIYENPDMVT